MSADAGTIDRVATAERDPGDRWKNFAGDEDKAAAAEAKLTEILKDATPFALSRWQKYREWEAVFRGEWEPTYYVGRTRVQARFLERCVDLVASACERELIRKPYLIDCKADSAEDLDCEAPGRAVLSTVMRTAGMRAEAKELFQESVLLGTSGLTWWYERIEEVARHPRRNPEMAQPDEEGEAKVKEGKPRAPTVKKRHRIRCEFVSDYDMLYPPRCKHPVRGQYLVIRLYWDEARVRSQLKSGAWKNADRILESIKKKTRGGGAVGVGAGGSTSVAGGLVTIQAAPDRPDAGGYKSPWADVAGQRRLEVLQVWFQHELYATDDEEPLDLDGGPVECLGYFVNGVCAEIRENPHGNLPSGERMRPVAIGRPRIISRQPTGSGTGDRGLETDLFCTDMLRLAGDAAWLEYQPMWIGAVAEQFTPEELRTHPGKLIPTDNPDNLKPFSLNQTLAPQAFAFYRNIFSEGSAAVGASETLQGTIGRNVSASQFGATRSNAAEALDVVVDNLEDLMVESGEITQLLIAQYFDEEMLVELAGGRYEDYVKVDPADLMARVRVRPIGAAEALRRKLDARENTAMLSVISGAAANGALPGINLRAGWRRHLQQLDWPALDEFLPPEDEGGPAYWKHEIFRWQAGEDPKVTPFDNDKEHIASMVAFAKTPEFRMLSQKQQRRFWAHYQDHQRSWAEKRQRRLAKLEQKQMQEAMAGGGRPRAGMPTPAMLQQMDIAGTGSGGLRTMPEEGQMDMPNGGLPPQLGANRGW